MKQHPWWAMGAAVVALAVGMGGQASSGGTGAQGGPPAAPARPAAPQKDDSPRRGIAASQAPADIAWGPGRMLQAGLVLTGRYGSPQQHTGRYVFGVYLRNRSKETLTVTCPSFDGLSVPWDQVDYTTLIQSRSIYSAPRLRDARGRLVDVGVRQGKETHTYTLAPGEVAMVSHWMLRTMGRRAKGKETADYTQVAFVDPGKYRVTCDVTPIMGDAARPAILRTGEIPFEVTPEDLKM